MKNIKILGFVLLVLIVGFGVMPLRKAVQAERTEHEKLTHSREQKAQKSRELQKMLAPNTATTKVVKSPERQIPLHAEQEKVMQDLYKLIRGLGFEFSSLQFSRTHNSTVNAPQLNISFTIEGRRSQILNFLRAVEANERFLGLTQLGEINNTEPNSGVIQMGVTLYTFYQEELE